MNREHTIDVSYELETRVPRSLGKVIADWWAGREPETEFVEHEFVMHYTVNGAEPDVGIMGSWIEDVYFTLDGMTALPLELEAAIEADAKWRERREEEACERADEPIDDYDWAM